MVSSLKTMNRVRKPVKKTAPVAAAAGAENETPVVEKKVAANKGISNKSVTKKVTAQQDVKLNNPEASKTANSVLAASSKKKVKINNASTPEDAIMQSEAVTPDLDKAIVPKKKIAKKATTRSKKSTAKKK